MTVINRAPLAAKVDDDGSNLTGSLVNKAFFTAVVMDPIDAALASLDADIAAAGGVTLPIAESDVTNLVSDLGAIASALAAKAPLASPALTGTPTAPTAALATNTTQIATTAFVLANAPAGGGAVVQTSTSTGTVNDFALTTGATQLRMNNATLATLTGLTAGTAGQRLVVVSVGAGQVDLTNEGAGSTAANRMIQGVTGTRSLSPGSGAALLEYDATTARWRVIAHEQGAWITPAYAGGNFTGSGSLVVTVDAGDVIAYGYRLSGRTLQIAVDLRAFSTSGTGAEVRILVPGGFTSTRNARAFVMISDNGTTRVSLWESGVSLTYIRVYADLAAPNWAASTNQSNIIGQLFFDVN